MGGSGTGTRVGGVEPVSLAEAKEHLRVLHSDEDAYITSLITTARIWAENFQRRRFLTTAETWYFDGWPSGNYITLPYPPLQSVTGVYYTNTSDVESTFATDNYDVDTNSEPGRIMLKYNKSWPTATLRPMNPIRVPFETGYGDVSNDVPMDVRNAILILVGDLYEHRETVIMGTTVSHLKTVENLLWMERMPPFTETT